MKLMKKKNVVIKVDYEECINSMYDKDIDRLMREAHIGGYDPQSITRAWIAKIGSTVVGASGLYLYENSGTQIGILKHLVVQDKYRKLGIGSELTTIRIKAGLAEGCKVLALCTMYYRFPFFVKRGFKNMPRKTLPDSIKDFPQFTDPALMKTGVMVMEIE